jgi:hypothetical protein
MDLFNNINIKDIKSNTNSNLNNNSKFKSKKKSIFNWFKGTSTYNKNKFNNDNSYNNSSYTNKKILNTNDYSSNNQNYSSNNECINKNKIKQFLLIIIFVYLFTKLLFNIFYPNKHNKNKNTEIIDIITVLSLSFILFFINTIGNIDINFITGIIFGIFFVFSINKYKDNIYSSDKSNQNIDVFLLIFISSIFTMSLFINYFYNINFNDKTFLFYTIFILGILLLLIITKKNNDIIIIDIGFIAWMYSLFIINNINNKYISNISGFLIGIFITNISLNGMKFILEPSSDIDNINICPNDLSNLDTSKMYLKEITHLKNSIHSFKFLSIIFIIIIIIILFFILQK